jgi:hypothetical protein
MQEDFDLREDDVRQGLQFEGVDFDDGRQVA